MQTQTISDPLPILIDILRHGIKIGELKEDLEVFNDRCNSLTGHALEEYLQEVFDRV